MIIAVLLTALVTCGGALAAATQIHYLHKGDAVYSQNGQVLYLAGADAMSCVLSRNNDGYSVVLGPRAVQVDKGDKTVFFRYVP
jgi:hypothetical protein